VLGVCVHPQSLGVVATMHLLDGRFLQLSQNYVHPQSLGVVATMHLLDHQFLLRNSYETVT